MRGRHLGIATKCIDTPELLRCADRGLEQARAADDDGHRLGTADSDVEPVQVVQEANTPWGVVSAGAVIE